ncbi:hypothetical protein BDW69DRAFT_190555 [Aspergillus filifer]
MAGPNAGTQRAWTPERFRKVLKRETQAWLGQALNITAYQDIAIRISWQFMRAGRAFTSNMQDKKEQPAAAAMLDADQEEGMDAEQWMAHIADLQAAHLSHVVGMVYGRQIMEQAGTTSHQQVMFRQSSVEWHEVLGFPQLQLQPQQGQEQEEDGYSNHHHQPLRIMDMTMAMQQVTGQPTMQFRDVQASTMAAIQQGHSPVVAIMPNPEGMVQEAHHRPRVPARRDADWRKKSGADASYT